MQMCKALLTHQIHALSATALVEMQARTQANTKNTCTHENVMHTHMHSHALTYTTQIMGIKVTALSQITFAYRVYLVEEGF